MATSQLRYQGPEPSQGALPWSFPAPALPLSQQLLISLASHSHGRLKPGFHLSPHPCMNGERSISCNLPGVLLTDGPSSLAALTNT